MSEPVINEDEMIGFIIRKGYENGCTLNFNDVTSVLAYQLLFYEEKGLIDTNKEVDEDTMNDMLREWGRKP